MTRPATTPTYASGQLVANSATAGLVVPFIIPLGNSQAQGMFRLTRIRLSKTGTTNTNATFRIHFYEASPTVTNGDTGVLLTNLALNWLGVIDLPSMLVFTDGCTGTGSAVAGSEMIIRCSSGKTIYALMAAGAAYVGQSSETFTLIIEELDSY